MVSGVAPAGRSERSGKGSNFPAGRRLLRHADFERVYKQGRRHFSAHLTAFFCRRPGSGGFRVGFTVGKVLGGAVERNRMKRRLREAVRLHWPEFIAPVDIVINPKKSVLKMDFEDLSKEMVRTFEVIKKQEAEAK